MSQATSFASLQGNIVGSYEDLKRDLEKYQRHEAELMKEIENINASFKLIGLPSSLLRDDSATKQVDLVKASGVVMRSQLSFRGKEKAKEYFEFIDLDNNDLIQYTQLRAIHSFSHPLGAISSSGFQSYPAWRAAMYDSHCPLQDGAMPLQSFLKYRTDIEHRQSLSHELLALKLGLLPEKLVFWSNIKKSYQQLFTWRKERRTFTKEELERLTDRLTFDEIQFLAHNLGRHYTKPELTLLLLGVYNRRKLMAQLLRVYSRLHLSEQDYQFRLNRHGRLIVNREEEKAVFSEPLQFIAEELQEVSTTEFTAWTLSCPPLIDMKRIYRRLMGFKYSFINFMRHVDSYSRWIFSLAAHCNDRLIFRDFPPLGRLLRRMQQMFTYKYIWYVNASAGAGEAGSSLQGLGFNMKLMRVDNLEATIKKLNAPATSATVVYFDLLLKDWGEKDKSAKSKKDNKPAAAATEETDKETMALVRLLHLFLQHHFEKDLKNSSGYMNNFQVYVTTNELDDARVIRVMVSYKKLVNIDKFIEFLIIPYKLNELVNIFMVDFRTNLDLQDVLTHNKLQSLNELLSCTLSVTASLRKNILAALCERLMLACSSGLSRDLASNAAEVKSSYASVNSDFRSSDGPRTVGTSAGDDDEDLRYLRWRDMIPYYDRIAAVCKAGYDYLSTVKAGTFRFYFRNLSDLYYQMGIWTESHIFKSIPRAVVEEPGAPRKAFMGWMATAKAELEKLFDSLRIQLEDKKREEDAMAWRQLLLVNSPQKKAGRNEVPGVKDADDLSVDSQVKAHEFIHEQALSLIHAQSKEQSDQEVLALRLLERLIKQVVGVHALEVISGKNKLSVLFQGCDFGELLQIASGGNMLPGSMQEEYEKAQSKKRNVSTAAASKYPNPQIWSIPRCLMKIYKHLLISLSQMPALVITTSATLPSGQARKAALQALSGMLARILRKPENYVMVVLKHADAIMFGGDDSLPAAFCNLHSVGNLSADTNAQLSLQICELLNSHLHVAKNRIFIQFYDSKVFNTQYEKNERVADIDILIRAKTLVTMAMCCSPFASSSIPRPTTY